MQAWRGWTAAAPTAGHTASTWEEWCAWQRRRIGSEPREHARQPDSVPFSARELARLSFVRWLYQTSRLAPAHNDTD
jgi:hypothetical protein